MRRRRRRKYVNMGQPNKIGRKRQGPDLPEMISPDSCCKWQLTTQPLCSASVIIMLSRDGRRLSYKRTTPSPQPAAIKFPVVLFEVSEVTQLSETVGMSCTQSSLVASHKRMTLTSPETRRDPWFCCHSVIKPEPLVLGSRSVRALQLETSFDSVLDSKSRQILTTPSSVNQRKFKFRCSEYCYVEEEREYGGESRTRSDHQKILVLGIDQFQGGESGPRGILVEDLVDPLAFLNVPDRNKIALISGNKQGLEGVEGDQGDHIRLVLQLRNLVIETTLGYSMKKRQNGWVCSLKKREEMQSCPNTHRQFSARAWTPESPIHFSGSSRFAPGISHSQDPSSASSR